MRHIVDDLEKAREFYTRVLGLEELPAYAFDYPLYHAGRGESG